MLIDTRKSIHIHINYELFAEILRDLAATVGVMPVEDVEHREKLANAAGSSSRPHRGGLETCGPWRSPVSAP
jgi:hypothetical protein